jgi:hypothetical protein
MAHGITLVLPPLRPPTVPRRRRDHTVQSRVCRDQAHTCLHIPRRVHGFPPTDGILRSQIIMMMYLVTKIASLIVHSLDRRHSREADR